MFECYNLQSPGSPGKSLNIKLSYLLRSSPFSAANNREDTLPTTSSPSAVDIYSHTGMDDMGRLVEEEICPVKNPSLWVAAD